jgi:hypothetical protein
MKTPGPFGFARGLAGSDEVVAQLINPKQRRAMVGEF